MSNSAKILYVGVTSDLERRVAEHKQKMVPGFTARYNLGRLVYYETTSDVKAAIEREKQIKGWVRRKKIQLIESMNTNWEDLSLSWASHGVQTLRSAQGDTDKSRSEPDEESALRSQTLRPPTQGDSLKEGVTQPDGVGR